MAPESVFRSEVEKSPGDELGNKVTTVACHGKLVAGNTDQIKEVVKPLIAQGGRIVVDLTDLNYLDSSGLGALLALKISALNRGFCILEFRNMTARILELLRITHLEQFFNG